MTSPFDSAAADGAGTPGAAETHTPAELWAASGTLAEAARQAALSFAIQDLVAVDSLGWWPAPVPSPDGPMLAYIVSLYQSDAEAQDYIVREPAAVVYVDPHSLEVRRHERWREAGTLESPPPLAYLLPPAAHALPEADRAALSQELLLLYEDVLPLVGQRGLTGDERATAERFARLFSFLVPEALMPAYERAAPAFVAWLQTLAGPGAEPAPPPRPDPTIQAPERTWPEAYELEAERYESLPATIWRLSDGALAAALQDLRLQAESHSPLAGLTAAPDAATLAAQVAPLRELGAVHDWPSPDWSAALEALCRPGWAMAQITGDAASASVACSYAGAGSDRTLWVRYWLEDGANVIAYPDSPTLVKQAVAGVLRLNDDGGDGGDGSDAQHTGPTAAYTLSAAGFRALVMRADPPPGGDSAAPSGDESGHSAERAGWREIAAAISPVPFVGAANEVADGGAIDLGSPEAYAGLLVTRYDANGESAESGVALVRSSTGVWLWEAASDFDASDERSAAAAGAALDLLRATPDDVQLVLDEFLGEDDPAYLPESPDEASVETEERNAIHAN